jgi:hypothetical protein
MLGEESFADLYCGWSEERLAFACDVHLPFTRVIEGDFRKGDSLELFIDTRDLKSKGVISRFCHHFVFTPGELQGFHGREVTRFRNEDIHRLCHPEDLQVEVDIQAKGYRLDIEIPTQCLFGFDPVASPRIGFTYRLNRSGGAPQHFAVSSEEYAIEQHPATWGTFKLEKEED